MAIPLFLDTSYMNVSSIARYKTATKPGLSTGKSWRVTAILWDSHWSLYMKYWSIDRKKSWLIFDSFMFKQYCPSILVWLIFWSIDFAMEKLYPSSGKIVIWNPPFWKIGPFVSVQNAPDCELNEKNQVPPKIPSKITFPLVPGVQGQLFVATSVFRKFHDFSCGFKPISSPFRIPNMLEASNILDDDPLSHLSHPPTKKTKMEQCFPTGNDIYNPGNTFRHLNLERCQKPQRLKTSTQKH